MTNRIIYLAIALTIFFSMVLPVMADPAEQPDKSGIVDGNIYILRYVLSKLIIQLIRIFQTVLQEDVGIGLNIEAQDAIEECIILLTLLKIQPVEKKKEK